MITVEIVLALILAVTLVAVLARAIAAPMPLLQVAAGMLLCTLPVFSRVRIDPTVFFVLFIPTLLYADGWLMPRRDLRQVLRPVLALAFGLVLATVLAVGYALHALVPGLPLAAAFALGAIVSPTDAVATAAMTERLPLPRKVTLILNGESLINDASGLVAFKFAVAALATGTFSLAEAGAELVWVAAMGTLVGLGVAYLAGRLQHAIARFSGNAMVHTMASLLTPFAAYLAAEHFDLSGILAVVAAGLYAGWSDGLLMGPVTRQHAMQVWGMVLFVFNGLVFLLLGLSLPAAIEALAERHDWSTLAWQAFALWVIVTVVRLAWVFPLAYLPSLVFRSFRSQSTAHPKGAFIVGWAGLRGSVTMAAALSLPLTLPGGAPFPGRELVIFFSATTILLTLLINGLTLPLFIRVLRLRTDDSAERELEAAEVALARAGSAALHAELPRLQAPEARRFAHQLIDEYEARAALHAADLAQRPRFAEAVRHRERLLLLALEAERKELAVLQRRGAINDETARALLPRIDHLELYATGARQKVGH